MLCVLSSRKNSALSLADYGVKVRLSLAYLLTIAYLAVGFRLYFPLKYITLAVQKYSTSRLSGQDSGGVK